MNTDMWNHPTTAKQLQLLAEFKYHMIAPVEKMLACGVVGRSNMLLVSYWYSTLD